MYDLIGVDLSSCDDPGPGFQPIDGQLTARIVEVAASRLRMWRLATGVIAVPRGLGHPVDVIADAIGGRIDEAQQQAATKLD